ncbi:MAG: hypothetical protein J2P44_05155, partial [Candidatus Dormibacteraeota bacterium]|nr:hypothetical protein [Candidatus Dormibacteraeota bacterium]
MSGGGEPLDVRLRPSSPRLGASHHVLRPAFLCREPLLRRHGGLDREDFPVGLVLVAPSRCPIPPLSRLVSRFGRSIPFLGRSIPFPGRSISLLGGSIPPLSHRGSLLRSLLVVRERGPIAPLEFPVALLEFPVALGSLPVVPRSLLITPGSLLVAPGSVLVAPCRRLVSALRL